MLQTFKRLNGTYPENGEKPPQYTNFFDPVMHDRSKMLKPSTAPVDFEIEVFDESLQELSELYDETIGKQIAANDFVGSVVFAVLDERGAEDDTVIICYDQITYDDETEEEVGQCLHHWRVTFADAHDLVNLIEDCGGDVIEEYTVNAGQRFTDENGVFQFAKAVKAVDAGDRG